MVLAAAGAWGVLLAGKAEPRREGVSLSEWLTRLEAGDVPQRVAAARAVGYLAEEALARCRPALVRALKDPTADVRLEAIKGLRGLGWEGLEPVLPALLARAGDEDLNVRFQILWLLDEHSARAGAADRGVALRRLGCEERVLLREYAVDVVAKVAPGDPAVVGALAAAVASDPSVRVRCAAARALARMGPAAAEAEGSLRRALEREQRFRVQEACAEALAALGGEAARDAQRLLERARARRHRLHADGPAREALALVAAAAPAGKSLLVGAFAARRLRLDVRATWDELCARVAEAARLPLRSEGRGRYVVGNLGEGSSRGGAPEVLRGRARGRRLPEGGGTLRDCAPVVLEDGRRGVVFPSAEPSSPGARELLDAAEEGDAVFFCGETIPKGWRARSVLLRRAR